MRSNQRGKWWIRMDGRLFPLCFAFALPCALCAPSLTKTIYQCCQMPWKDLITPRQWLACDPLPPGLDLTSKHWVSLSNAVSHSHSGVHWLWLLRKFVIPLFGKLRIFGVFILAKCCGSFTKYDTYFLRSLDFSLFFSKWIFYTYSWIGKSKKFVLIQ